MSILHLITGQPSSSNTESSVQAALPTAAATMPLARGEDVKALTEEIVPTMQAEAVTVAHGVYSHTVPSFVTVVEQVTAKATEDIPIPWLHGNQPMVK